MANAGGRLLVATALLLAPAVAPAVTADAPHGALLYGGRCASCHGVAGRGDGPDANLFLPGPPRLHDGFLAGRDTAELVRRILDGARRPLALDPHALRARLTDTGAIVAHLEAMPDVNWTLVDRGQDVFLDRCELCHGPYGRPPAAARSAAAPPDLSAPAFQQGIRDEEMARAVRHGRDGMPAIPALRSDADAWALVAFVRVLSPGFELYSRHCASCHGRDGRPQREFGDPRQRPTVVFDRPWLERRNPTQLRAAVLHMLEERQPAMPHFRTTLSEPEARAIVRYLRDMD